MMDRRLRARTVIGYKNTAAVPWCLLCELITLSLISHSSVTLLLSHTDTQTHTQTHTHTHTHRHTQTHTHTHTPLFFCPLLLRGASSSYFSALFVDFHLTSLNATD